MTRVTGATASAFVIAVLVAGCDNGTEPAPPKENIDVVGQVGIAINTSEDRSPISPFIYGSNQDTGTDVWTVRRYGGNRITGYNWENNFSNAGSDWQHSSDLFAISNAGLSASDAAIPARSMTYFHDQSVAAGAESIISLQMAGYVAKDGNGIVAPSETAPSPRWVKVEPRKGAPFTTVPSLDDGVVYMDELVNLFVQRNGGASTDDGVRWYSLDNEPALWSHTHPRIHPEPVGAKELVERSVALASAVKAVDPDSKILGPALYGIGAYASLQDAPDWNEVRAGHSWFIDLYLDQMRQAEQAAGMRLLDALDVHWYPEATGDNRIIDQNANTAKDVAARLQAPRTLWDPTYKENSWVAQHLGSFLPILPRLQQSIDKYYPGTQLAVTEYNYGGGASISGGLAQADALGAFGKYGVDIATIWGIGPNDVYTSAGFKLYRNYDGQRGTFGSTSVRALSDDLARASVYASINDQDPSTLYVILINKEQQGPVAMRVNVVGGTSYSRGQVWGFDSVSPRVTRRGDIDAIASNTFTYVVPPLTALHIILR